MEITVKDAARLLNVSEKSIYRWIKQGKLPAFKLNEQYRFNRTELLEWATAGKLNVSPDIFREPDGTTDPMPTIEEALQAGGIYYRIEGCDKERVLRAVVEHMRLPDEVDREFLLQVLLAREELGSTSIGDGIAIPHVRNPVVLHVPRPSMTLCFLETPIEFGAIDGKPVHALFTLVSPTIRGHLHMLSRLSFALRQDRFLDVIRRQAVREDILGEVRRIENGLENSNIEKGEDK
ncbi:MAG: PTS sugar transporter subunit IIA [Desulfobacterales bacterium]|nr:PTS sugar transporter subunit IIA [Desulfobacterales bacterium]MDD4072429.1 PTS sugar transporter subunit IIA [Desulfobacterales bacterium]MDD4393810.1 PTS sugar transporter subunit IIA [Desulfobacterales bacterium]